MIVVRAALLVALAACGGKKAEPPPAEETVEEDAGIEELELTAGVDSGELAVELAMKTVAPERGLVVYLDEMYSEAWLAVENRSDRALTVTLPGYLYARMLDYEYPYGGEGCLPDEQFLFAPPTIDVTLPAGGRLSQHVTEIWYLGNAERPAPHAAGASRSVYAVREAPEEDGLVRLAVRLEDRPELAARAFTIAGGCTREEWLLAGLADDPVEEIDAIEHQLRFAGYPVGSRFPIFTKLRARRGGPFP